MRKRTPIILPLLVAAFSGAAVASPPVPEGAFASGLVKQGSPQIEARLLVHPDDPAGAHPDDPDASVRLGVLFDLAPGWHVYWRHPGESGLAPELRWQVDGAVVGPVAWPAPQRFEEGEGAIETFGYAGQVLLASRARFVSEAPEPRRARLEAEVLACRTECVPARFSLSRSLEPGPAPDREREVFEHFARKLPVSPQGAGVEVLPLWSPEAIGPGEPFEVSLAVFGAGSGGAAPAFYPIPPPGGELRVAGSEAHPAERGAWMLRLAGRAGESGRVAGVLGLGDAGGRLRHVEIDLPVPVRTARAEAPALALALGLALLGGLLLNLMPCVLPVLAIKVFALTGLSAHGRGEARRQGLAYGAGVLASMAVLAATVVGLRAAGTSVGWGFQLQEPLFVAGISALLVLFACNLFGAFEIGSGPAALSEVGAAASGARRSFFEGLLAVALATPCTAPFLGTAVGFAFASSAPVIAAVFAAIGVGLAAPFVGVSFVPGLARFLPRPGAWMLRLRSALGFALLATVVWLVWVFGRGAGADAIAGLLAFLLTVAVLAWSYGLLQARGTRWLSQGAALAIAGLALGAPGLVSVGPAQPGARADALCARPAPPSPDGWRPYDRAEVAAEVERGRPVFVSFTADWCITCKLNERLVLDDERVEAALAEGGFELFRADWTRRDEAIRSELARFGKAGVPLYVLYRPSARPELLPELLTVDRVLQALEGRPGA